MTGPQPMLLQPDEDHQDDTGQFLAASRTRKAAEAAAIIAAHQHRAPRFADRLRGLIRGHRDVPPAPVSQLLAPEGEERSENGSPARGPAS